MSEQHSGRRTETLDQLRSRLQAESSDGLRLSRSLTNNPICSVYIDDGVPCIVVAWKQYATSNQLRFVHESILQLLQTHNMDRILGDDTALPTIHPEDRHWIVDNWMPRAKAAGLIAVASKVPNAYFGRLAVQSVQSVAPSDLALRSFERIEDARHWLRSLMPPTPARYSATG